MIDLDRARHLFWLAVWSVKFSMLFFFRRFLLPIPSYMEGSVYAYFNLI